MVSCNVCGERPAEVKARIESSVLLVCGQCASLGSVIARLGAQVKSQKFFAAPAKEQEVGEELVEDYALKIRAARESANLTQEEFALKLNVGLAVLKAAESNKRLDLQTAKRIEKALGIKLLLSQ
jgi:uncharacterized protein (TIGR00270 family)